MACTLSPISGTTPRDVHQTDRKLHRAFSSRDLQGRTRIRRSYSDNHLCYSIRASSPQPKLKSSRSMGFFNIQLSSAMIPDTIKSFLDLDTSKEMAVEENLEETHHAEEIEIDQMKRANWIERLLELRNNWKQKQGKDEGDADGETKDCEEEGCEAEYDEDGEGTEISIDRETFLSLLGHVPWSDAKLIAQLAFLSNMAYVIQDIKTEDLKRYYGLDFVTSSLEKKAEVEIIKEKIEQDSTRVPVAAPEIMDTCSDQAQNSEQRTCHRSSTAYEIAALAASYVQSRAKDLQGSQPKPNEDNEDGHQKQEGESPSSRIYKSEMAACVAASTMTTVVAAGEKQKEEAARDLQSLHSSPCEWFICDDSDIYTRCFVIQGSDSLASWQANLFFEPTKFEGTDVLVHRGIYEAAKGIHDQFMPEINQHLNKFGERAKFQFTGHSLGGSLALLVNLMLLARKEVNKSCLLPVVTFGSPYVFCGGQKILDQLGLDEDHIHCVMMHRDIVPRAFSCNYPNYVAQVLKRLNRTFRSHPCLNKSKLLYSPMGKLFILQPDERSSPPHPLLPPESALYNLVSNNSFLTKHAIRAFLNSPHPIETLSDPTAYGSEGTILRDHDSSNYLKAMNEVIRQHTRLVVKKSRKPKSHLWPLLTSRSPHAWSHTCNIEDRLELPKKVLTGV